MISCVATSTGTHPEPRGQFSRGVDTEEADSDERPSGEAWARLVASARQVLGEVSVFEGAHNYELTHEPTGIQVSYYAEEAGITVPYWYRGEDARAVVTWA